MRQGDIAKEILFDFYINEVKSDISKLQAGSTLNCTKVNILGCAHHLVLVASTAQAFQFLLNALTLKLNTLTPRKCSEVMHFCFQTQQ